MLKLVTMVLFTLVIALVTEVCSLVRFDSLIRLSATLVLPITNALGCCAACVVPGSNANTRPVMIVSLVNIMHPYPTHSL